MGDEDRGAVLEVFFYELHDFFAGQIVEAFKRLVEQDGVSRPGAVKMEEVALSAKYILENKLL